LGGNQGGGPRDGNGAPPQRQAPTGGFQPSQGFQPPQGPQPPQGGPGGRGGGGGFFNTGTPGALRLFIPPLSKEASWLLPFGILCALLLIFRARLRWPLAPKHQALVLWGGWLLTVGVFFSIAGFFHEYYLSTLAPPLSALVGIGVIELWRVHEKRAWLATGLLLIAAAAMLWLQFNTASAIIGLIGWLPFVIGLFGIGATFLIASVMSKLKGAAVAGFVCVVAALMLTPGIWSGLTNLNASTNQTLPAAYYGGQASFGPAGQGGAGTQLTGLQVNQALLAFLEANTQGMKYLMAVPSSMQGADYVIATGRPVLYLGGFSGQDAVETSDSLAQLVANGELRYIYLGGGGGPGGGAQSNVSSWVATNCKAVQGYDTGTQNFGAPDGTGSAGTTGGGFSRGFSGAMLVSLYDCGG
jgi:4-amino-4-deoxy-L-arabinose transferase-like glycosyltransferase